MDALEPHRPRGPRLYHKKSRTGCVRCKQRRVKCDEQHPKCGGCARHNVDCLYPAQIASPASVTSTPSPSPSAAPRSRVRTAAAAQAAQAAQTAGPGGPGGGGSRLHPSSTKLLEAKPLPGPLDASAAAKNPSIAESPQSLGSQASPGSDDGEPDTDIEIPESRHRRIWEMRLLHNHLIMGHPFNVTPTYKLQHLWEVDVPNMALRDGWDVVLYGILAHSALNMWSRAATPEERDHLIILQQTYKTMMLREQARQVGGMTSKNADPLCFSSLKILTHALALVQTLPMDPWEPPLEWLRMGKGAGAVFRAALDLVNPDDGDKIRLFLENPPIMTDPNDHIGSDHSPLAWLLAHPEPDSDDARNDTELEEPDARCAYEGALGYTCSVARAIERGEPEDSIGRRLGGFAVWVNNDFTQFLIERRPRAMVILAHFMALWIDYDHIWIIGKAGERQIRGIHKSLPLAWSSKLDGLFARLGKRPGTQGIMTPRHFGQGT